MIRAGVLKTTEMSLIKVLRKLGFVMKNDKKHLKEI
jgi:hypothetical protein